jgi:hypothetical protein
VQTHSPIDDAAALVMELFPIRPIRLGMRYEICGDIKPFGRVLLGGEVYNVLTNPISVRHFAQAPVPGQDASQSTSPFSGHGKNGDKIMVEGYNGVSFFKEHFDETWPPKDPAMFRRAVVFLLGLIFLACAIFANAIGIDNDPGWGSGRFFLLLVGAVLVLTSAAVFLYQQRLLPAKAAVPIEKSMRWLRACLLKLARWYPLAAALTLLVWFGLAAYGAWITSAGRFPVFPAGGGFYAKMAEGFMHGQLSLLEQPDPKLLALADPYDMLARDASGAKVVWDASLYNGKYYIYWGPVPAVILAVCQWITGIPASNAMLVFCFYAGLAAALAGVLHLLRKRYYPRAPGISVPIFLVAACLNLHLLWLIGRPAVYEASIISGQFFLFSGLLFWLIFLEKNKARWLVLAGLCWGFAAGSRNTLLVSVGVYTGFALLHIWRVSGWKISQIPWEKAAALVLPLALCGLAIGIYNFQRFGNPMETGVTYQLSLAVNPKYHFSPGFIPTNLYMWLFYRFDLSETFPFFPYRITYQLQFPAWMVRPPYKMFDREFYGLLPSMPVTWLIFLGIPLLIGLARKERSRIKAGFSALFDRLPLERLEVSAMILLAGLFQFAILMGFFYAATRYGADFTQPGILVAALITWELDAKISQRPKLRAALWLAVAILSITTAAIGAFGAFTVPESLLRKTNPMLYQAVAKHWNVVGAYIAGFLRLAGKIIPH